MYYLFNGIYTLVTRFIVQRFGFLVWQVHFAIMKALKAFGWFLAGKAMVQWCGVPYVNQRVFAGCH